MNSQLKYLLLSVKLDSDDIDHIIVYNMTLFDLCCKMRNFYKNIKYKDIKTIMFLRSLVGIANHLPYFFCDHGHIKAIFYNTYTYQQYKDFYETMQLFWACKELSIDFKNVCIDNLKKLNYNAVILNGLVKFRLFNKKCVRHLFYNKLIESNESPFYRIWYNNHVEKIIFREKICQKVDIKITCVTFNPIKLTMFYDILIKKECIKKWQSHLSVCSHHKPMQEQCIDLDFKKNKHISYYSFDFIKSLIRDQLLDYYYDNCQFTKNIKISSYDKLLFQIKLNTQMEKNNTINENFIMNN